MIVERRKDTISLALPDDGIERAMPGGPPVAFRIWRFGENMTDHGMTLFSERSAALLMAEQAARGNPYSIDIDHMSLDPCAPLANHKAVGRHRLEVREGDGLWAVMVELCEMIRSGLACDPPEWLSFSPAYDLDKDTGEVISYINTAITNNPATWNVTQLATRTGLLIGDSTMALSKKDMVAAFEHMAKGEMDSASMSSFATAMLAVINSGGLKDVEPPPAEGAPEPDGDEGKPSDGDGDAPADKPAEEEEAAKKMDSRVLNLLTSLEADRRRIAAEREAEKVAAERKTLLASRKIANADARAWLESTSTPIEEVRAACKVLPPVEVPNLAAAISVQATRGSDQGGRSKVDPTIAADIDARMGIRSSKPSIRSEDGGRVHVLGALYGREGHEEAKRILATKEGA
jgi:hypothetical protein